MQLTAPVLVPSMPQSGMIFDSVTIQLLILSRRRLSTAHQQQEEIRGKIWAISTKVAILVQSINPLLTSTGRYTEHQSLLRFVLWDGNSISYLVALIYSVKTHIRLREFTDLHYVVLFSSHL